MSIRSVGALAMDVHNGNTSLRPRKRRRGEKVAAACDLCKTRKVKCDGEKPCAYCVSRERSCTFSAARTRGTSKSPLHTARNQPSLGSSCHHDRSPHADNQDAMRIATAPAATRVADDADDQRSAAVPLEGRLLQDTQGKHTFIGDSAPLSFLQTVKQLVCSGSDALTRSQLQGVRDSVIESSLQHGYGNVRDVRDLPEGLVKDLIKDYLTATKGLIDLFHGEHLLNVIKNGLTSRTDGVVYAVIQLVLAIGAQENDERTASAWVSRAQAVLLGEMCTDMTLSTVQGFTLLTIYMLRAFQPNGAYLFLSLAIRSAYAIGIHRAEANASFGYSTGALRDHVWKSLRCLDTLISSMLGRPPSSSDLDCTVQYLSSEPDADIGRHILDASVQIFMIMERVVVEVYSRKRISLRIAHFVSRQLKTWASKWLQLLNAVLSSESSPPALRVGACQTLSSYFHAITLLARPFLVHGLCSDLRSEAKGEAVPQRHDVEKRHFANGALDAAVESVEMITKAIASGDMPRRLPMLVSWIFSASLVLILGLIDNGKISCEQTCKDSIACLDYFSSIDPHARQYSIVTQSLLQVALAYRERRELQLRQLRKQASSQLFGLLARDPTPTQSEEPVAPSAAASSFQATSSAVAKGTDLTMYEEDFFSMPWPGENDRGLQAFFHPGGDGFDDSWVDIPLFPMNDGFADLLTDGGDVAMERPVISKDY